MIMRMRADEEKETNGVEGVELVVLDEGDELGGVDHGDLLLAVVEVLEHGVEGAGGDALVLGVEGDLLGPVLVVLSGGNEGGELGRLVGEDGAVGLDVLALDDEGNIT